MNNEGKVTQIYNTAYKQCIEDGYPEIIATTCAIMCKTGAEIMAKWKDEQFNEEKNELIGLINMLPVDDHNQTIIEDLKALLR